MGEALLVRVILIAAALTGLQADNAWTEISPVGQLPAERYGHAAVWSPAEDGFYVFGGHSGNNGSRLNDLQVYSPQVNAWIEMSPNGTAPTARNGHSVVWSPNEDGFYVFGGTDGSDRNDLRFYSRQANTWTEISPTGTAPTARRNHVTVWSPTDDGFYLFGGNNGSYSSPNYFNDLHFYSRKDNKWSEISASGIAPEARINPAAVWSPTEKGFYLFGGLAGGYRNDFHFYSAEVNAWTEITASGAPTARYLAVATWSPAEKGFYLFGGYGNSYENDLHFFSPKANTWTELSPSGTVPAARRHHVAVWSPSQVGFYVFGGFDGSVQNDLHFCSTQADNAWTEINPDGTLPARDDHVAVWSPEDASFYIFSGKITWSHRYNDLHVYSTQGKNWTNINASGSTPTARGDSAAVWSPSEDGFYVFGGWDTCCRQNDLHFYSREDNSWAKIDPRWNATVPSARSGHVVVWSPAEEGFYLFGGYDGSNRNDLHFYSRQANEWTEINAGGTIPSIIGNHVAVWSPAEDGFYAFGGFNGTSRRNDLHFYSRQAKAWTELHPSGTAPEARNGHVAAWSPVEDGFYVFGGNDGTGRRNDLHFYSRQANSWSQITPAGVVPAVCQAHSAVWSPAENGFYAFGGTGDSGVRNDLYFYSQKVTTTTLTTTRDLTSVTSTGTTMTATQTTVEINDGITAAALEALEEKRKEQAAEAVKAVKSAENKAVEDARKLLESSNSTTPGVLGEVTLKTPAGPVTVAALSLESMADAEQPATITAGEDSGVSLEISAAVLGQVAAVAKSTAVLLSITLLNGEASSSFKTDNVLAESRRLSASSLQSRPTSITFRTGEGEEVEVKNLKDPLQLVLAVDDPAATCAYWDEETAKWSSEGVETRPHEVPGHIVCSTTHLSIFGGVVEVALRNVVLALTCSTFSSLMDSAAFGKMVQLKWFDRPAAVVMMLALLVFAFALVLSHRADQRSLQALPWSERERILMRLKASSSQEEEKEGEGVFRMALNILPAGLVQPSQTATIDKCIELLQSHRSGADRATIHAFQNGCDVSEDGPASSTAARPTSVLARMSRAAMASVQRGGWKVQAMQKHVFESGTGEAKRFLDGNVFRRVLMLFPAAHKWAKVGQLSIVVPRTVRVAVIATKVFGSAALSATFFSSTAPAPGSDPDCSPPPDWFPRLVRSATVGVVTASLGDVFIFILLWIVVKKVREQEEWTEEMKVLQRRRWRIRTCVFWILVAGYDSFAVVYAFNFVANVRKVDAAQWLESVMWALLQDLVLKPIPVVLILALVSTFVLARNPSLKREIESKWLKETSSSVVAPSTLGTETNEEVDAPSRASDVIEGLWHGQPMPESGAEGQKDEPEQEPAEDAAIYRMDESPIAPPEAEVFEASEASESKQPKKKKVAKKASEAMETSGSKAKKFKKLAKPAAKPSAKGPDDRKGLLRDTE